MAKKPIAPERSATVERRTWPSLATVGAVASIIGLMLAVVLFFFH